MMPGLPSFPIQQIYFKEEPAGKFQYAGFPIEIIMGVQGYWCQALGFGVVAISTTIQAQIASRSEEERREQYERFHNQIAGKLLDEELSQAKYFVTTDGGTGVFLEKLIEHKDEFHVKLINFSERMSMNIDAIPVREEPDTVAPGMEPKGEPQ